MCSYHGWRFSSSGGCVRIPQADSPEAEATACASKRSCAVSFPVKVSSGGRCAGAAAGDMLLLLMMVGDAGGARSLLVPCCCCWCSCQEVLLAPGWKPVVLLFTPWQAAC
jgi:hypothetical protein